MRRFVNAATRLSAAAMAAAAATVAAILSASGSALAADLPTKSPVLKAPVLSPDSSWAGFYMGVHGGYGWGRTDWTQLDNTGAISNTPPGTSFSLDPRGGVFGGQIGHNWQSGSIVYGMEVSGSWTDLKQTKAVPLPLQLDDTFTARIRDLVMATGRLGYAMDRTLLYLKGGYAVANVRTNAVDSLTGNQVGNAPNTWADDRWHNGWTVGGGWGFKVAPNMSLEVDYSYVKLQTRDHTATVLNSAGGPMLGTVAASVASYDIDPHIHAVTARFNYNFSGR